MDRDIGLKCDIVHFDDQSAVRKAVLALANEGHRKIAIIIGDKENILSVQRFEGYLEGLKRLVFHMTKILYLEEHIRGCQDIR